MDKQEVYVMMGIASGLFIACIIRIATSESYWTNSKVLILILASGGIGSQVGAPLYEHLFKPTQNEIRLQEIGAVNESQACLKSGFLAIDFRWEAVPGYICKTHHPRTPPKSSFCSRLMCVDRNQLLHEIYPPMCNQRNLDGCK